MPLEQNNRRYEDLLLDSPQDYVVEILHERGLCGRGLPYYLVKNSWGVNNPYRVTWYMSRDYMAFNAAYLFLKRNALPKPLRREVRR